MAELLRLSHAYRETSEFRMGKLLAVAEMEMEDNPMYTSNAGTKLVAQICIWFALPLVVVSTPSPSSSSSRS